MKIKTEFVPDNAKTYLTVGKVYETVEKDNMGIYIGDAWIKDDTGQLICVCFNDCEHLDNRDWSICDAK